MVPGFSRSAARALSRLSLKYFFQSAWYFSCFFRLASLRLFHSGFLLLPAARIPTLSGRPQIGTKALRQLIVACDQLLQLQTPCARPISRFVEIEGQRQGDQSVVQKRLARNLLSYILKIAFFEPPERSENRGLPEVGQPLSTLLVNGLPRSLYFKPEQRPVQLLPCGNEL